MRTLSLTPKAESDLIDIWGYTCEEWGADQADDYLDQLEAGMRPLLQHPLPGTDYAHVLPGHRRLQVEHHAVFCRVLEAGGG
ncbi:type II toxin-antitoxin system RelE/ParE family toxin [Alloalcanivorax profundimaris]|uniref:type II toxin-antitoxin system RelE/ParE family toxin n=1 Tax=Alloalcanivorax profundimaris TaxID=2735259 RepID=UPI002B2215C5|nr:type II toxin-antitoxin system RelE/ParE family toxin [Alloalcanivorax profundimaris]